MATITEQDRATARRVIRRHVDVHGHARVDETNIPGLSRTVGWKNGARAWARVDFDTFDAACEAAALGRAYGRALRAAK